MTGVEILVSVAIAVGLVGIAVPVLPGSLLVVAAILLWASETGGATAWVVFVVALGLVAVGTVVKYVVPGRRLREAGVPAVTLWAGGLLGVVGFFVVPVVGLPLGFLLGVYLAEWRRVGHRGAGPATVTALRAVGLGMLVEFSFTFLAALTWAIGVVVT